MENKEVDEKEQAAQLATADWPAGLSLLLKPLLEQYGHTIVFRGPGGTGTIRSWCTEGPDEDGMPIKMPVAEFVSKYCLDSGLKNRFAWVVKEGQACTRAEPETHARLFTLFSVLVAFHT